MFAEGGGFNVDGEETVLTTQQYFPNLYRNPGGSREEVEEELCRALGVHVVWLPGVVLVERTTDPKSRRYEIHAEGIRALSGQTDAKGREPVGFHRGGLRGRVRERDVCYVLHQLLRR
jgi:agmatine deiminase